MSNNLKNKTRLGGISMKNELVEQMKELNSKTGINLTKLYEMAVEEFLMNCSNNVVYPITREKIRTEKLEDTNYVVEKDKK
jgi:hypothetical protein